MLLPGRRFTPLLTALGVTATALADEPPPADPPVRLPSVSPISMIPTSPDETVEAPPGPLRENPWREHPLALEVQGALGGPLGIVGAALDYAISERVAVNAGVGVGRGAAESSLAARLQYALSARVRFPLTAPLSPLQLAFGPEVGLSEGSFRSVLGCTGRAEDCSRSAWSHVLWANTNAFFELRQGHFQLRAFAGAATPLASEGTRSCTTSSGGGSSCYPAPSGNPSVVVNLGAAVGLTLF